MSAPSRIFLRPIWLGIALALMASGVGAQAGVTASAHRPWVWCAQRNGATLYLAGCLHLGTAEDAACFSAYLPYFDRAATVYFELMPGAWQGADIGQLISRRGYVAARATLSSRLSSAGWQQVAQALAPEPALLQRLLPMEPWMVSLTLSQEGYRRAGLQPQNALDSYLTARAIAQRKAVGALEKPKDQILALADAGLDDQERNLLASLANFRTPDFACAALRQAWRSGDLTALQAGFGADGSPQSGDTHENLLAHRNQQWLRKLTAAAVPNRPSLFVIGIEHLISQPGDLPELLTRAGFSVHRVGITPEKLPPTEIIVQRSTPTRGS